MKVLDKIKGIFTEKRNKGGYGNFEKWFKPYNMFTGRSGFVLGNNEMVFAAITKLSNAMASLPLKLYEDLQPQNGHRLNYIMSSAPNENMTSLGFIQSMEVLRNVYGNAYALKRYDKNCCVEALDILDPTRVEPVIEEKTKELYYRLDTPSGYYYIHNADVIHVRHISTSQKGISPIDVLRNTIEYDSKIRKFSLDQMDHSIKASYALKVATNLGAEKKAELYEDFKKFYSGENNVIILEQGFALDPLKSDFIDPKLFEAEKITKARIALVFNMPLYKLGDETQLGNEQQALGFVQDTLLPIVRQYEQEFDKKLLTVEEKMKGYAFKFIMNGLLRADTKTRADFYFKGIRTGFLTPDEVRQWEELPPLPGGDKLYMSKDLQAIGSTGGEEVKQS